MRFLSLASRNLKEIYRDPLAIAWGMVFPAVLMPAIISIGKNAPLEIFTANALTPAVAVFSFGFFNFVFSYNFSKRS
nr:hypothetical protein [Methanobacterium formicicum]